MGRPFVRKSKHAAQALVRPLRPASCAQPFPRPARRTTATLHRALCAACQLNVATYRTPQRHFCDTSATRLLVPARRTVTTAPPASRAWASGTKSRHTCLERNLVHACIYPLAHATHTVTHDPERAIVQRRVLRGTLPDPACRWQGAGISGDHSRTTYLRRQHVRAARASTS